MNNDSFRRCPQYDVLVRKLIEAYRTVEDREIFTFARGNGSPEEYVSDIHRAMEQHRQGCPICTPALLQPQKVKRVDHSLA